MRRAADECLSPYKHDAQASVSENSLACASCLYADSCRSPKSRRDFDRLGRTASRIPPRIVTHTHEGWGARKETTAPALPRGTCRVTVCRGHTAKSRDRRSPKFRVRCSGQYRAGTSPPPLRPQARNGRTNPPPSAEGSSACGPGRDSAQRISRNRREFLATIATTS